MSLLILFQFIQTRPRSKFRINLKLENKQNGQLIITNFLGQVVYLKELKQPNSQYNETIELSGVASGLYTININLDSHRLNKKIVIQ